MKYSLNKTTQNATKSNQYYQSMLFNTQKLKKTTNAIPSQENGFS